MLQIEQAINYSKDLEVINDDVEEHDELLDMVFAENKMQLVPVTNGRINTESDFSSYDRDSKLNILSIMSHTTDENCDPLMNLPAYWTKLDLLNRKNFMSKTGYSTKVTNAINKLESLQDNIEKWIALVEKDLALMNPSECSNSSRRLFEYVKKKSIGTVSKRSEIKFIEHSTSKLQGNNPSVTSLDLIKKKSELVNTGDSIEMKMNGVLEDVLMLISRLEFDRRSLEQQLKAEKETFKKLKAQIESTSQRRALLLPEFVQKEHERNITDITELKFHILFNTKSKEKLIRKVEVEQKVHERLTLEVENLTSTMPLIEEKCAIEKVLLNEVENEQIRVDDLLQNAYDRLKNVQERTVQAENKARIERETMQSEIDHCKRDLNKAKKRHQDAIDKSNENVETIEMCKRKIIENVELEKQEIQKRIRFKKRNDNLTEEIKVTKIKRVEIDKENLAIEYENNELAQVLSQKTEKFNKEIEDLTELKLVKQEKLEKVLKKNKEKEIDIDEMNRHQAQVESKISKEVRNKERIDENLSKIEDELNAASASLENMIKASSTTSNDQEKEMKRLEQRESVLKKQIMDLKKQISEERNGAAVLLSKMKTETEDFERSKLEAEQQQQVFEANKIELDKRVADMGIKVAATEGRMQKYEAEVAGLTEQLNQVITDFHTLEARQNQRIKELEPQHIDTSAQFRKNTEVLSQMKRHTIDLNKKMVDMFEEIKIMTSKTDLTGKETAELTEFYKELVIQYEAVKVLEAKTEACLAEQIERMNTSDNGHNEFYKQRTDYYDRIQSQLADNCKYNKELATRYRQLKYGIYNARLEIMRNLDTKLEKMYNLKDKRQLKSLQDRMHTALRDFFTCKIKHSESNYEDLEMKREDVADKIENLESLLHSSVQHVTRFLHHQMESSHVRKMNNQKVEDKETVESNKIAKETAELADEINRLRANSGAVTKKQSKPLPPIGFNLVNPV